MDQILDSHQVEAGIAPTYAGFWTRFGAMIIDGIIVAIAQGILSGLTVGSVFLGNRASIEEGLGTRIMILYIIVIAVQWLYYSLTESSTSQATLGKMAVGIKVTDEQGGRISFGQATARFFSKLISGLILFIGYFMMLWSDKRQCLHDKIAGTLVVKKA
jgi:uncharacterized RDD family membrane protein YckC